MDVRTPRSAAPRTHAPRPRGFERFLLGVGMVCVGTALLPGTARAQSDGSLLIETAIPDNFDRDRNVSVLERPHPDYDPLDIRLGTFVLAPQIEGGAGATNNVYLTSSNRQSDGYVYTSPSALLRSDWARDELLLSATSTIRRYLTQTRRDETTYNLRALGAKDVGPNFTFTGETQYAKLIETPDTGAIDPSLSVLSSYRRSYLAGRAQYRAGRSRAILALDRTGFTFEDIDTGGRIINQSDRDRIVSRATGEYQYALSPSLSAYGQFTYGTIDYSRALLNGTANRDSEGVRAIGGVNFDLAGLVRGKIGVGYIDRDFHSPLYHDAHGFSAESLIEYFPSPLTTLGLVLSRTLQDTSVSTTGAYFENRVTARVDHELLNNLIVSGAGEFRRQTYVDSPVHTNYYRALASTRYLVSRFFNLNGSISYLYRGSYALGSGQFSEVRAQIGVTARR
jgi:hypothetical protein